MIDEHLYIAVLSNIFRLSWATLLSLLCFGTALLLIASIVVLSLIPTFLTSDASKVKISMKSKKFEIPLVGNNVIPVGTLNDAQKAVVEKFVLVFTDDP